MMSPAVIDAKARYWSKLQFLPQLGGAHRNIAITIGVEKLEWCGYPMVKNFCRYVYFFQQNTQM